jgi:hypothetical protein
MIPGVPQGLPGMGAAPLAAFGDALKSIGAVAREIVPFVDSLHKSFEKFGDWLRNNAGMVGRTLENLAGAIGRIATVGAASAAAMTTFGSAITGIVAKANPAVAAQFTLALNDLLAVIGQALTPVLKIVTEVTRLFADTLLAVSDTVGGALTSVFQSLVPVIESMLEVFAEFAVIAAEVLKAVAPLIVVVLKGFTDIFKWIAEKIKEVLALFGISTGDVEVKKGASVGAAVRSASETSVEAVLSKARTSAYSLGTASMDPAAKTASAAEAIKARADAIYELIKGLPRDFANIIMGLFDSKEERDRKATERALMSPEARAMDAEVDRHKTVRALREMFLEMGTGGAFGKEKKRRADARAGGDGPGVVGPAAP